MEPDINRAVAIVGVGAILPDAPDAPAFWKNLCDKRYSITEVPPDRWSIADYYDPDPSAPDKTYSKIGGWVRGFSFDWKRFRIPPRVAAAMDEGQQWAVTIAAAALADYGYPRSAARPGAHRRHSGHGDGRRAALSDSPARRVPRVRQRSGSCRRVPAAARRCSRAAS